MNRNKNSTWSDGNDNQRDEEGTLKTQREGSQCVCVWRVMMDYEKRTSWQIKDTGEKRKKSE